ncbi:hypothetical protein BHU72_13455 [Desulfuribacillus stibiiarsenatis]|uniref:UPF0178 protein BHU72_13455 n=1 Tax=Desulfuribacillus stibiiarsenatis TaxID=1390249 RepID=A0A1E5L8V2_9FIRM|nr:DUF188 domain-containing protein [Desulfuribacillus stibiiarsenatis]OEH86419.1 hypothetical protein BHU72_13455 [Desulfuribacillus stibiiarsenatis]
MKIIVDADACPKAALQICFSLGQEFSVPVWTVASFNHNIESDHHITVDSGSQEADIKIINIATKGDIVVTQDWGLAAMVLGKPAKCISPIGIQYKPERIEFLMEEREAKAKLRRGGGRTKGPRKRTTEDDRKFESGLRRLLMTASDDMNESLIDR